MKSSKVDPLVSCPIVCDEYMRASGFFFTTRGETFLITARHNVLPTDGATLVTGEVSSSFVTDNYLPTIDVYLRSSNGFEVKKIDTREVNGVKETPEIDVLGVPVDFDPEEYGYQVWSSDDVTSVFESMGELEIIGFEGTSFPDSDREYDTEMYCEEIGRPSLLTLMNEMKDTDGKTSQYGLVAVGVDDNFVGNNEDYNGLSGAPVLGDGLVGVHGWNKFPRQYLEQTGEDEVMLMVYWRAEILPELLN